MSEMVDRVAAAVSAAFDTPLSGSEERLIARAALLEQREATDAMCVAASQVSYVMRCGITRDQAKMLWDVMIVEALK